MSQLDQRLTVHQALHGYDDGHRLLAASLKLPKDVERLMLPLSDLSGQGSGGMFEPYLTGYPLKSIACYAFAKTWHAPEMGRPGCVWTHTLLVDAAAIERDLDIKLLHKLHSRPAKGDYAAYSTPMTLLGFEDNVKEDLLGDRVAVYVLYSLLYSAFGRIGISVHSNEHVEDAVLKMWSALWPGLKSRFTFCTGAKAPRVLDGQPFQVHAVAEKDFSRFKKRSHLYSMDYIRVERVQCDDTALVPWFEYVHDRPFLVSSGMVEQLPLSFTSMRIVTELLAQLRRTADNQAAFAVIDYLGKQFPDKGEGNEYKSFFLGKASFFAFSDFEVLKGLMGTKMQMAFSEADLDVANRAASCWSDPDAALRLTAAAIDTVGRPISDLVLQGLATSIPEKQIAVLIGLSEHAFECFLEHNPGLALKSCIWSVAQAYFPRVIDALVKSKDKVIAGLGQIVANALGSHVDFGWKDLGRAFGAGLIDSILDECQERGCASLPPRCEELLIEHWPLVRKWLGRRSDIRLGTIKVILSAFEGAESLIAASLVPHVEKNMSEITKDIGLCVQLFSISLKENSIALVMLAQASLDSVYSATANSAITELEWDKLCQVLPKGDWWRTWDQCVRICRAVAGKFWRGEWPIAMLVSITKSEKVFRGIVDELRRDPAGRELLIQATRSASELQKKVLMGGDEFID